MEDMILGVIATGVVFLSHHFFVYLRTKNIYEKFKCISNDTHDYIKTILHNTLNQANAPTECKFNKNNSAEAQCINTILTEFKNKHLEWFFKQDKTDLTQKSKAIYKLDGEEFCIYCLFLYLDLINEPQYGWTAKDKIYKNSNKGLTEHGKAYYKLYLSSALYCENNFYIKPLTIRKTNSTDILNSLKYNLYL